MYKLYLKVLMLTNTYSLCPWYYFIRWSSMYYVGRVMRKRVFGHTGTAKAQINLRIRAVWSGPSLSANRIIEEWFTGEQMPGWYFAHVQDDVNQHSLFISGPTFLAIPQDVIAVVGGVARLYCQANLKPALYVWRLLGGNQSQLNNLR